jgi:HK97 family phage portal protein
LNAKTYITNLARALTGTLPGTPSKDAKLYSSGAAWSGMNFTFSKEHPYSGKPEQLRAYTNLIYAAVSTIAGDMAKLHIDAKASNDSRAKLLPNHPALALLRRPTRFMPGNLFRQTMQLHQELTGESFTYVEKISSGLPIQLHTLYPDRILIIPHPKEYLRGYVYTAFSGQVIGLLPDEVLHVRNAHPSDPYRGYSPVEALGFTPQISSTLRAYVATYMKNNARPDLVFSAKSVLGEDHLRMLDQIWRENHQGVDQAGSVGWLDGEMTPHPLSSPLKELEVKNLDNWAREDVVATYNVPLAVLGLVADSNRANTEGAILQYQARCLAPRAVMQQEQFIQPLFDMFGDAAQGEIENPVPSDRSRDFTEALAEWQRGAITHRQYLQRLNREEADTASDVYFLPNNGRIVSTLEPAPDPIQPDPNLETKPVKADAKNAAVQARFQHLRGVFALEYRERRSGNYRADHALERWQHELQNTDAAAELIRGIDARVRDQGAHATYEWLKADGARTLARIMTGDTQ